MPEIEIRQAHPQDRETVLAFCTNTWEWGDYIEDVWDKWLSNPEGQLLVAISDDRPVGMVHIQMLNETESWQEGMRIDPAYRRQRIGWQLTMEASAEAMRRGATTTRLITETTNLATIQMVEQMHFRRIGVFAPHSATPVTDIPKSNAKLEAPVLATPDDLDEIINYLDVSNVFPAVGGIYYLGFVAYRISDTLLMDKIRAGQVYVLKRWDRLDGLAIAEPRLGRQGKHLFIGYIDGTTESISQLAYILRHKLSDSDSETVDSHVPDLMMVRDAFAGAEYTWSGSLLYTYEKSLI
jgi:ribosomal protein S18 acetylase RimI-like enzyme